MPSACLIMRTTTGAPVLHEKNVLVVEDELMLGTNLCAYLERHGWRTLLAGTGAGAVAAAASFAPAVVLLDYQLPDMTGFDVLGALARHHVRCGCILMTAYPMDTVDDTLRQHGIAHVLCKPFSMVDMQRHLLAAMAGGAPLPTIVPP